MYRDKNLDRRLTARRGCAGDAARERGAFAQFRTMVGDDAPASIDAVYISTDADVTFAPGLLCRELMFACMRQASGFVARHGACDRPTSIAGASCPIGSSVQPYSSAFRWHAA